MATELIDINSQGHPEIHEGLSRSPEGIGSSSVPGRVPMIDKHHAGQATERLRYLDGLRGFGALLVYLLHYQVFTHSDDDRAIMESSYGYDGKYHFSAMPFIRLFFTGGHHAVMVFFIISGYSISRSHLLAIYTGDTTKMASGLSSAIFRRWLRLWLPVAATTFLYMSSWHLLGAKTVQTVAGDSYLQDILRWFKVLRETSFMYTDNIFSSYNIHLWTIPDEFRGSVVVFTTILALSAIDTTKRLCCEILLLWYFTYVVDGWYCSLFVIGMTLCDLDLANDFSSLYFSRFKALSTRLQSWLWPLVLILSIYLGGVPCWQGDVKWLRKQPGWYLLSYLKPGAMKDFRWFFRGLGAVLTIVSVPRIKLARRFFECSICQYLGKISYCFYLVHGPIIFTLGERLYAASGRVKDHHATLIPQWVNWLPLSSEGPVGLEINHIAPQLILLPFTIWMADLATRYIDNPSIRFTKWLLQWLTNRDARRSSLDRLA